MPRSSESVAALASALAKAQTELINPEKSLVGVLPAQRGGREQTFRYAPLSGGLEIARRTLGRHEIATIQSTAIDRDSGTIKLTTTLAHASGEWITSDWPVCSLADLPTPHRMGTALTYARRYGLFTLVGIAGDDDLDAPDLSLHYKPGPQSELPAQNPSPPLAPVSRGKERKSNAPRPIVLLNVEASIPLRDELLAELDVVSSFEAAATWAKRIIPLKNTLTAEHAQEVETALLAKLDQLGGVFCQEPCVSRDSKGLKPGANEEETTSLASADRSTLTIGHPPRRRNKAHLKFVAAQPCLLCGRQPSDPHHLRFAQPQALGRKVSDEFTVPLCRTHHRQLHRSGREGDWWKVTQPNLEPLKIAKSLWDQSQAMAPLSNSRDRSG